MVRPQVEIAGRFSRLFAAVIDAFLLAFLNFLTFRDPREVAPGVLAAGSIVLYFGYFWIQHGIWGQTIGKRMLNIKVISVDFEEIGQGTAALRVGFQLAFSLLTLGAGGLLDVAWILWDRDNQALRDKVAGTWVVSTTPPAAKRASADPYGHVPHGRP